MSEWRYTEFGQIPAEWDLKTVDEIKSSEKYSMSMGPFGSNITVDNFISEGVPVIRGVNLNFDRFVDGEFVFVSKEKADQLKSSNCKSGDLVFTHRGTIGQVGLIPFKTKYERYIISQSGMKLTVDSRKVEPLFAFYFFKSRYGQFQLLKNESQVGVPSISTPLTSLKEIEIPIPPLIEQHSIASILSSLDDKIDLLHRQNKTLEALAEALFKQWFLENAEGGWKTGKLGDVIETIESGSRPKGGIDPKLREGIPSIGAENINGLGYYDYSKTKFITQEFYNSMKRGFIKNYDILIYKDGAYIGRKGMFANGFPYDICTVNEHVFILRANPRVNQFFLYFLLNQEELEQLNANSAQPGLNQESMKSFEIVIPSNELIKKFEEIVKVWIDKIFFNSNQIRTLARLRDTLLPKLMSGDVRIK